MKEKRFPHTRKPLHRRRLWVAEGGMLQSHGGERSHRDAEGKAERYPRGGSVPTSTPQPERLVCSPARAGGDWELRLWDPEVGSQGEDWGWLHEHSLKGASAPQLDGSVSRKRSGAAKKARDFLASLFHGARGEGIKSAA